MYEQSVYMYTLEEVLLARVLSASFGIFIAILIWSIFDTRKSAKARKDTEEARKSDQEHANTVSRHLTEDGLILRKNNELIVKDDHIIVHYGGGSLEFDIAYVDERWTIVMFMQDGDRYFVPMSAVNRSIKRARKQWHKLAHITIEASEQENPDWLASS